MLQMTMKNQIERLQEQIILIRHQPIGLRLQDILTQKIKIQYVTYMFRLKKQMKISLVVTLDIT